MQALTYCVKDKNKSVSVLLSDSALVRKIFTYIPLYLINFLLKLYVFVVYNAFTTDSVRL